ncbi:MAG: S-layer family protein, partial [Deltaproteobacteria bacterium]|nr:S-layer family protein [Deltaproteobacteria bacterium]
AEGDAGDIDVQVGKLTLQHGGGIFTGVGARVFNKDGSFTFFGTDHTGRGGKLTVKATEGIFISGRISPFAASGLFTQALKGSGDGGQLFVSTPVLDIRDGGGIASDTESQSTGNAGGIRLEVGKLTLTGGALIFSGTLGPGQGGDIKLEVGKLALDGGFISAQTLSDGNAGDIEVRVGKLTISNGGVIASSAGSFGPSGDLIGGSGHAGNITVIAIDAISIAGRDRDGFTSGLFTDAFKGSGDGGHLFVSAPTVTIGDGGEIFAGTSPTSTGNAGDIRLEVGRLAITGDADIASSTAGPGRGGDIQVQARQIELTNSKAAITASSSGSRNAGNIEIHADDTFRSRNSTVSTSSLHSGGGKIDLSAGQIVELVDSQITTTVQGGTGDAGNITIDPHYVILNNSQVIARAVEGNGGNIHIGADVFIASPASVVDASSQKGISGTVDIRGVVNTLSGSLYPLPQEYLRDAALVADRCAGRRREGQVSSFVVSGRAGMPLQPGGVLPSPLYDTGQVRAQGGMGRNDDQRVVWQMPKITPITLDGGCKR